MRRIDARIAAARVALTALTAAAALTAASVPAAAVPNPAHSERHSAARFRVSRGRILAPDGKPFVAHGIDLNDADLFTGDVRTVVTRFPGLNLIRLAVESGPDYPSAARLNAPVRALTRAHIVVVIEDHAIAQTYTGSRLRLELAFYRAVAAHFRHDPYVWFGTLNEPDTYQDPGLTYADLIAQQVATYRTVRAAGNTSPILMELRGGFLAEPTIDYASAFAHMSGIAFDLHFYAWATQNTSGFPTRQSQVDACLMDDASPACGVAPRGCALATTCRVPGTATAYGVGGIALIRSRIHTRDGVVPVVIGEFGPSTTGELPLDSNYREVLHASERWSGGAAAWSWDEGSAALDRLPLFERNVQRWCAEALSRAS